MASAVFDFFEYGLGIFGHGDLLLVEGLGRGTEISQLLEFLSDDRIIHINSAVQDLDEGLFGNQAGRQPEVERLPAGWRFFFGGGGGVKIGFDFVFGGAALVEVRPGILELRDFCSPDPSWRGWVWARRASRPIGWRNQTRDSL